MKKSPAATDGGWRNVFLEKLFKPSSFILALFLGFPHLLLFSWCSVYTVYNKFSYRRVFFATLPLPCIILGKPKSKKKNREAWECRLYSVFCFHHCKGKNYIDSVFRSKFCKVKTFLHFWMLLNLACYPWPGSSPCMHGVRKPGRSDHVPSDVLCMVLCVVLIIKLFPTQSTPSIVIGILRCCWSSGCHWNHT